MEIDWQVIKTCIVQKVVRKERMNLKPLPPVGYVISKKKVLITLKILSFSLHIHNTHE